MFTAEREVDRYLTLLRNKIRERGFTQLQVQEELGWGRSYLSQLLTKQKALRIGQVLAILDVIGVDPSDFFAELYGSPAYYRGQQQPAAPVADLNHGLQNLKGMVEGLIGLLVDKKLVSAEDLAGLRDADPDQDSG